MREVLIRHCWKARVMPKLRRANTDKTTSRRISRAFDGHIFRELQFDFTNDPELEEDVRALTQHLQDNFHYETEKHWKVVGKVITFNTLFDTQNTYSYFHKEGPARQRQQSTSNQ
jgi:hypothetical protein